MTRILLVEAAEEEEDEVGGGTVVMLPRCLQQLTVSLVAVETALMPRHQYTA